MGCKHLTKFVVFLMAVSFSLAAAGGVALAKKENTGKILEKVSKEANTAMRDVRFARIAIFDGQPKAAVKYLEDAKKNLALAEKKAPEMVVTVTTKQKMGDKTVTKEKATETTDFVPIDAWLALSENFVPSAEKSAKIKEANKHLKKGNSAKAIEILRAANIGLSVTRVMMPLKLTMVHINGALDMLKQHKYYEANLALKGAEDGLITDTVLLYEPLGKAGKKAKKK